MNGRPLTTRKKIQVLVAFTILTWATHTLLHQWGYGAEIPGTNPAPAPRAVEAVPSAIEASATSVVEANVPSRVEANAPVAIGAPAAASEKFVPARYARGGTLELRAEASVYGGEVRLRQICRWSEPDAATFVPVADLVVLRIGDKTSFKSITLDGLRTILSGAGVNLGSVRFAGPTICTVRRSDVHADDATLTMEQWIDARRGQTTADLTPAAPPMHEIAMPVALSVTSDPIVAAALLPATRPSTRPAASAASSATVRSLRSLLLNDLSIRLGIAVEQLEVSFNPSDNNLLNLSEPMFQFNLEARRARDLGKVEWEVTVVAGGSSRKADVAATARAWQNQVIAERPLSYHQSIRSEDVSERRLLIDHISDEPVLTLAECVGQLAARELKPQTVLTARMVDPVTLAKPGQLITVKANQRHIQITTVARALEAGSIGQRIRVRNEVTNDMFDIVLTGPQEGVVGVSPDAAKPVPGRRTGE